MEVLSRTKLEKAIEQTSGHFFSAEFVKKDKSIRKINARLGVKKFLKGGENKVEKASNGYMTVYDMVVHGYRTLNLDTVSKVTLAGRTYQVV